MSFVSELNNLDIGGLTGIAEHATAANVEAALARSGHRSLADFAALISPAAAPFLETMARESHAATIKHFGKAMRMFAPIYVTNECVNNCKYCGFSRDNPILRTSLTVEQTMAEAQYLLSEGFRNILLVAGEHPKFASTTFLSDCTSALHKAGVPSISIEVAPLATDEYRSIVQAGCEGLVVYQETYNRAVYSEMHTAGPKKDFGWRLETPERGYEAGMRRLGIAPLIGLWKWQEEAISAAAHAEYLLRKCWRAQVTISMPRLRPAAGEFAPRYQMTDRQVVQYVCALRLTFPHVGIVLSTRETPRLRDGLIPLGITMISAGSHTEPGGYTGAGSEKLHVTKKGKFVNLPAIGSEGEHGRATEQFVIADDRSASEMASKLRSMGYEPVWKDWDPALSERIAS